MSQDTINITAARIIVGGRVQGVGYRWFVQDAADRLGLVGTVENLANGDVAVYTEGTRELIEELIADLKRGNGHSRVDNCNVIWDEPKGKLHDFRINLGRW